MGLAEAVTVLEHVRGVLPGEDHGVASSPLQEALLELGRQVDAAFAGMSRALAANEAAILARFEAVGNPGFRPPSAVGKAEVLEPPEALLRLQTIWAGLTAPVRVRVGMMVP